MFNTIISTDAVTGIITYDESSGHVLVFEHELNLAGDDVREECDLGSSASGGFNSPRDLANSNYEDVYMYACSSDCKLIEKKWTDPTSASYVYNADYSTYKKWDCAIDLTEVSWTDKDIKN
jgi:hypothetical protein